MDVFKLYFKFMNSAPDNVLYIMYPYCTKIPRPYRVQTNWYGHQVNAISIFKNFKIKFSIKNC